MKKIILILLFLLLTGCTNKVKLDLNMIDNNIKNLTNDKFDIDSAYYDFFDSNMFINLEKIEIFDLENYNIDSNNVDEMLFLKNNRNFIIVVKALNDRDKLKDEFDTLCSRLLINKKIEFDTIDNYFIYASDNNLMEIAKNSKSKIYNRIISVNDNELGEFNLKKEWLEEYSIKKDIDDNFYMVIKPNKNYKSSIDKAIDEYILSLEKLNERLILKKNINKFSKYEYNYYLIYIKSTDNEKVLKAIKEK